MLNVQDCLHVGLNDSCPDHGQCTKEETTGDSLDGGEVDTGLAKCWVDDRVHDWDQDDQSKGIQVGKNVVGESVQRHNGGLRYQVVVELVIGKPVQREPKEHAARCESSSNFIDPLVVKSHPCRPGAIGEPAGLDILPEGTIVEIFVGLHGIDRPSTLVCEQEKLRRLAKNASLGWSASVNVAAEEHDEWADAQHNGREKVRKVEAFKLLSVSHGNLTDCNC